MSAKQSKAAARSASTANRRAQLAEERQQQREQLLYRSNKRAAENQAALQGPAKLAPLQRWVAQQHVFIIDEIVDSVCRQQC